MTRDPVEAGGANSAALAVRVTIGLAQAAALAALHDSFDTPLCLVTALMPLVLMLGYGQVPPRGLILWFAGAAAVVAGLGLHAEARGAFDPERMPTILGQPRLLAATGLGLAVAHVLAVDAIRDRRLFPPYARRFDTASRLAIQIGLVIAFTAAAWAILLLGAASFNMLGIRFLFDLMGNRWFAYPATGLAVAVGIHVTDVQPALIRGARSLALTLPSWLLPPLALILLAFLASLTFVSLAPLWATGFAATLLLLSAGSLVFLINSCYQDGAPALSEPLWKRIAVTVASLELVPLVGLAARALWLRAEQYGWTVDRVLLAAVIAIAACVALGYVVATLASTKHPRHLETANIVAACGVLAAVLALFSPVADPGRLMVANQMSRLDSGAVAVKDFDFAALKFDGARWGAAALDALARTETGPEAASIRVAASAALARQTRRATAPATAEEMAKRVVVLPAGRALPPGFFEADLRDASGAGVSCLRDGAAPCVARFMVLRPGSGEGLLWMDRFVTHFYEVDAAGKWNRTGSLAGMTACPQVRAALERGEFELRPNDWPDLVVGNRRLAWTSPVDGMC